MNNLTVESANQMRLVQKFKNCFNQRERMLIGAQQSDKGN